MKTCTSFLTAAVLLTGAPRDHKPLIPNLTIPEP